MKIITINLSAPHVKALSILQELGLYPSRSEAIRVALRDFLQKEFGIGSVTKSDGSQGYSWVQLESKTVSQQVQEKKAEISRILHKLRDETKGGLQANEIDEGGNGNANSHG